MTTRRAHNNDHRRSRPVHRHGIHNKFDLHCETFARTAARNLLDTQRRGEFDNCFELLRSPTALLCCFGMLITFIKFSMTTHADSSCQEINYDSPRGGVSVITEKGDITTSYLLIQRARSSDNGKYVCLPSNANSQTINVHVLNGNYMGKFSLFSLVIRLGKFT